MLVWDVKCELTLCFDSVADGARVAQTVRISCSHQEQVDGAGLQTLQNEALRLHVIRERLPAAARRMAAVHTTQIKRQFTLRPTLCSEISQLQTLFQTMRLPQNSGLSGKHRSGYDYLWHAAANGLGIYRNTICL